MGRIILQFDLPEGATIESHTFEPGDTVKGRAFLRVAVQEKIDQVQIAFKGKVYTSIIRQRGQSRTRDTEEVVLFRESIQLFRGPFTAQPQTFEWPFSFTFPTSASHNRGQRSADGHFLPPGASALPPTFELSGAGMTGRSEAQVSYAVKVQVNAGSLTRSSEHRQPLYFCPTIRDVVSTPVLKLVRFPVASWSSRSLRAEQHTFKQKLSHVFSMDPELRTPQISFHLEMGIPDRLTAEQRTPFALALRLNKTGPTDPENPTLVLEHIYVTIVDNVAIRASSLFRDVERVNTSNSGHMNYTHLNKPLPLDGSCIYPIEDFALSKFPEFARMQPVFRTWTIVLKTMMKVTAVIKHVESGHNFTVKKESIPFTYLPPHVGGDPSSGEFDTALPIYPTDQAGSSSGIAPPEYPDSVVPLMAPPEYDYQTTARDDGDAKKSTHAP